MSNPQTAEQALAEALAHTTTGERDDGVPYNPTTRKLMAQEILAALPEGWSLTATPPDSDAQVLAAEAVLQLGKVHAQVAVLREALASADCDQDSPRVRHALSDTEATAKAYRDEVERPWREATRDALMPLPDDKKDDPDFFAEWDRITEQGYERLRALLSNTESAPSATKNRHDKRNPLDNRTDIRNHDEFGNHIP